MKGKSQTTGGAMKLVTVVLSFLTATLGRVQAQSVDDFRSHQSGNWNSTATWERWNGTSWVTPAPGTPASANGVITILIGHTVTVSANVTVDQVVVSSGAQVSVSGGVTLTIANGTGTDLTIGGTLNNAGTVSLNGGAAIAVNAGGSYQHALNGGTIPAATWDPASLCLITGTVANLPGGLNQTFGNMTWNCASQTSTGTLGSTLALAGSLTIQSTGTTGQFRFASGTSTIGGSYTQSGGSVRVGGGSSRTISVAGNFSMSAGTLEMASSGSAGLVNVGGNFSHTGGTITESGTSSTSGFVFNGTGTQSYTAGGTITNIVNFTVNSAATLSMGSAVMSGGGGFTLSAGATLGIGSASGITTSGATGNVQVAGTRSYSTGANYIYNGSAPQVTGNGLPATANGLTVSNAGGLSLTADLAIAAAGSATLTSGSLSTAGHTLTINASAPAALQLGTNQISGTVVRAIASGSMGTYQFFGPNAYIIPGGTGNPTSITATVFPGTNPPSLNPGADTNTIVKRYYTISGVGMGGGFSYTMRLSYAQSEARGSESAYSMWENSGGGWVDVGVSSAPDTAANFVEKSGLTAFSNWTVAEAAAPLPIQLASFQGAVLANSSDVRLSWSTLSEVNNYGFYVQRSSQPSAGFVDCANGFVRGSGTSLIPLQYSWTEKGVVPGTYYYRLMQVDLDGTSSPSEAVKVVVATTTAVRNAGIPAVFALDQNYPNPFNPSTRIQFTVAATGQAKVVVYNLLGDEIATLFAGIAEAGKMYAVSFDGSSLANGAYFCRLTSGGKSEMRKMILLK